MPHAHELRCRGRLRTGEPCRFVYATTTGGRVTFRVAPKAATFWGVAFFDCPACDAECIWTPPHVARHLSALSAG